MSNLRPWGTALALCFVVACAGTEQSPAPGAVHASPDAGAGGAGGAVSGSGTGGAPAVDGGGGAIASGGSAGAGLQSGAGGSPDLAPDASGDGGADSGGVTGPDGGVLGDGSATGTVGALCSPEGATACAGHAQKLRLVCRGGAWKANGRCAATESCDTTPGGNAGACQTIVSQCVGQTSGAVVCKGTDQLMCGVDLVNTSRVATCPYLCTDGICTGGCTPGTRQCNGFFPETCDPTGAWTDTSPCPNVCSGGACAGTCGPGQTQCNGQVLQTCDANGAWQDGAACSGHACVSGACVGVCEPGTSGCASNGVQICGVDGQWGAGAACSGQACVSGACVGVCEPGTTQCGGGNGVQTCSASGQYGTSTACSNQACVGGACVGACTPGTSQCSGLVPRTCDTNGAWVSGAACPNVCTGGACSGTCQPGDKQCNGALPQTCDVAGSWQNVAACVNKACVNGVCSGVCAPGATRCVSNGVQTCLLTGQWGPGAACVASACVSGACTGVCAPGATQCSGTSSLQTCTGSGQFGSAVACTNQACVSGACTGVCAPGTKQCNILVPQTCDVNGAWVSGTACPNVCSAGACSGTCSPGTKQCVGQIPQSCDVNGSWQGSTTCANSACVGGICAGVCSPGATQCSNNGVQTCSVNGTWGPAATCTNSACAGGVCTGVCVPATVQCVGQVPQTCTGSGVWQSGATCTNQACVGGSCTGVCTPGATRCTSNAVELCDATGQWGAPSAPCVGLCTGGACQPPSCTDGLLNQTETAVDCGGTCPGCAPGRTCVVDGDCQRAPCESGTCAQICPAGQFMTGYDGAGSIQCASLDAVTRATVNQSCWSYLGWRDSCSACTTDPAKWGRANHAGCLVGAGTNSTCQTPTLGGQPVTLFGVNTDGAVNDDDKFYSTLHCLPLTATTGTAPTACPAGQFVSGSTTGTLQCSTMDAAVTSYVRQSCNLYFGWSDVCNACTTVPTKWGFSGDSGCTNGVGLDDTCTTPSDGTSVLNTFGLNTDAAVDDNDTFYMGMHCTGATAATSSATGSCPAGQFVTKVDGDGSVQCAAAASFIQSYVRSGCNLYFGWQDSCNGCTTAPTKWGRTNDTSCANGAGTNGTCIAQSLGTETVNLLGVNMDGGVNDDDKFYTGLECY